MSGTPPTRSPGLAAACAASVLLAVCFCVLALLALLAGHSTFSGGVAVALLVWAGIVGSAGVLLWFGRRFASGVVVFAGMLHLLAFGEMVPSNAWALLGAAAGLVSAVGPLLPSSRAALSREG